MFRIAIGSDHLGYSLKTALIALLRKTGYPVDDLGTHSTELVDFPDIAQRVAAAVTNDEADRGIMITATGIGAVIATNKFPGIRAAVCHDRYTAWASVTRTDVNVLCLGGTIIGAAAAWDVVEAFMAAEFSTDPHFIRRVEKLADLEQQAAALTTHSGDTTT